MADRRCRPPLTYRKFRTGLTWQDIRDELRRESEQAYRKGQYMWIGRSTVLGRWWQHKQAGWEQYLRDYCERDADFPF